ncbi:hypothetical protein PMAYCL1PPCAC_27634, partial [Pristionchus mayeri]
EISSASDSSSSTKSNEKKVKKKPLFEEEWSKIYPDELVIRSYYFPTAMNKSVLTKQIRGIYYRNVDFIPTIGDTKTWGMSLSPCWWACDMQRKWRANPIDAVHKGTAFYNVVVENGESTMK